MRDSTCAGKEPWKATVAKKQISKQTMLCQVLQGGMEHAIFSQAEKSKSGSTLCEPTDALVSLGKVTEVLALCARC